MAFPLGAWRCRPVVDQITDMFQLPLHRRSAGAACGRLVAFIAILVWGCGDASNVIDPGPPNAGILYELTDLPLLDPNREGSYEAWAVRDGLIFSLGRFTVTGTSNDTILFPPFPEPAHAFVTVEPPGDTDARPSLHKLLGGAFDGDTAALTTSGYLTVSGIPLEPAPGTHVLGTPSNDDADGFPSSEDAGIWLFNAGRDTSDAEYYLDFSPLSEGWFYEGWIVHDYGTPEAVWISYGKFRPDRLRQARIRDDTGVGVFSGRIDYEVALDSVLRVPGDDWLANPLGRAVPGGFALPLDLNGDPAAGEPSRWTHVITIEPWPPNTDAEDPSAARPFFLQPYRNAIGEDDPDVPREILFVGRTPFGRATVVH